MTRINVIPVEELCDKHLFAEFRELTRIPNGLVTGKLKPHYADRPLAYTLGAGHVKFFTNKLTWLRRRYNALYAELVYRGYNITYIWPDDASYVCAWFDYVPDQQATDINQARVIERMPKNPKWTGRDTPSYWVNAIGENHE